MRGVESREGLKTGAPVPGAESARLMTRGEVLGRGNGSGVRGRDDGGVARGRGRSACSDWMLAREMARVLALGCQLGVDGRKVDTPASEGELGGGVADGVRCCRRSVAASVAMIDRKSSGFLEPLEGVAFVQGCNLVGGGDPSGVYEGAEGENDTGVGGTLLLSVVGVYPGILFDLVGASSVKSSIVNGSSISLNGGSAGLICGESRGGILGDPLGRS